MATDTRADRPVGLLASLGGLLGGTIDRALLVVAVLAAGAVPSFIAQYRQRVSGMFEQVRADLAPFQAIAERFHGGSLQALIAHHRNSADPTFNAESEAIESMLFSLSRLREAAEGLNTDLSSQILFLVRNGDPSIAQATWQVFEPSFAMSPPNLVFALVAGFAIWLICAGLWSGVVWMFSPRQR